MGSSQPSRALFVGFHTWLNQTALTKALCAAQGLEAGLVSRSNFLGGSARVFVSSRRGFKDCGFDASRGWEMPSRRLLEALKPSEAIALRMMDRTHRSGGCGWNLETRKRRWLEWTCYAYGFLRRHGFEAVYFCNVPHYPFEYALHEVARLLGLRTGFLMQLQVQQTFIAADRIEDLWAPMRLASASPRPALVERMRSELERRRRMHQPFYMHGRGVPAMVRFHAWQRRLLRFTQIGLAANLEYWNARRARGWSSSERKPYVYFPLHLQPEATTSPLGGVYVELQLVVEMLVKALPAGWLLVVKENPKQRLAKRSSAFYRRLASMQSVRIASRAEDSFGLMQGASAVAAVTGTAGWEALCSGKPVFVFGEAFYRHAKGALAVDDLAGLAAALARVQDGAYETASLGDLEQLLAALQHSTHRGICDVAYFRDLAMDRDEAVERCAESLLHLIQQP